MRTLPSSLDTEKDAAQSGWAEVVDLYLKESITTPFGSTNVLRMTNVPGGVAFFKPTVPPEPDGTQGDAADYFYWPWKRAAVRSSNKNAADRMTFTASNVTTDFAQMLADVSFYDCWIVVRKISTSIAGAAASDCVVLFIGQVDSWNTTPEQVQFNVSGDLTALNIVLPRENMHQNCRFNWADDFCTKLRWHADHFKAKTCGASSTTTQINSAGLTEDAGSAGSYGTDEIDSLADGAITASSEVAEVSGISVTVSTFYQMFFKSGGHGMSEGDPVVFAGTTPPGAITFGVTYYVRITSDPKYFRVAATPGGASLGLSTSGSSVTYTRLGHEGHEVRASNGQGWKFDIADWGTNTNGYYQIPDAQAGYENAALEPYIQFDLGSAKALRLWLVKSFTSEQPEDLCRNLLFFSSSDASSWTFESHYEMPPVGDTFYEVRIPSAASARYWRICVRSKWGADATISALKEVQAYTGGRHYWRHGRVTFDAATATAGLQGVSRRIAESYSGEIIVAPPLPFAPAGGDTFKIERGCGRSFADCCERKNTENFGGFLDLANQTIIR